MTSYVPGTQEKDLSKVIMALQQIAGRLGRIKLAANATYYVRTNGSDSNDGLSNSATGAFLTIQKAIDVVCALDLSIYAVTIQVATGTYTAPVTLKTYVGVGPVTLLGDATTPINVVISTVGFCISAPTVLGAWVVNGFRITSSGAGGFNISGSNITLGNINYGPVSTYHLNIEFTSNVSVFGAQTISGGAQIHWLVSHDSALDVRVGTYSFTTNPTNFSLQFANVSLASSLQCNGLTFGNIGFATGTRYLVDRNGVIDTAGGGATYLPGTVAGSSPTGGIYA